MTPNKTRDDQAMVDADGRLWDNEQDKSYYVQGYCKGFDAAEKQYMGELALSKANENQADKRMKNWRDGYANISKRLKEANTEIESLNADLESAVEALEQWKREVAGDMFVGSRFDNVYVLTEQTLSTLKSKLGREEKLNVVREN